MLEFLTQLFDTSGFPPRWQCGQWTLAQGWLHILSDLGVWSAYVAIPCVIAFFVQRRMDIPFRFVFVLFGLFILACGTTHLMEAIIFWWPAYRLAGSIKLLTALVSWTTVFALVRITPGVLAMRSPEELQREIEERRRLEAELRQAQLELEKKVEDRTAKLALANQGLQSEIEQRKQVEEKLEQQVELRTAELRQMNERLQARARQQTSLAKFGQLVMERDDITGLLQEVVQEISRTLDVDFCWLAEPSPDGSTAVLRAVWPGTPDHIDARHSEFGIESQVDYCLRAGEPVKVANLREEARFEPSPYLLKLGAVSGLCLPIKGKAGSHRAFGVNSRRHREFTPDEVVFLQVFANMLGVSLDRVQAERRVHASLAEKEVLLKEIHHRVKNNLQVISSLLDLQSFHIRDAAAIEMFRESKNRVRSMALLHERLYRSQDLARVDFARYLEGLVDYLFQSYRVDADKIQLQLRIDPDIALPIDIAMPCSLLVNELVSNCIKHAFPDSRPGVIRVELEPVENQLCLCISDNGIGLPEAIDPQEAGTFGLQLAAMLVDQLKGAVRVERTEGTTYRVSFPLPKPEVSRG